MSLEITRKFAALFDENKFDEAIKLMAKECSYHYSEGNYQGRENIINIYRQHDKESQKLFEEIRYASEVLEMPE